MVTICYAQCKTTIFWCIWGYLGKSFTGIQKFWGHSFIGHIWQPIYYTDIDYWLNGTFTFVVYMRLRNGSVSPATRHITVQSRPRWVCSGLWGYKETPFVDSSLLQHETLVVCTKIPFCYSERWWGRAGSMGSVHRNSHFECYGFMMLPR